MRGRTYYSAVIKGTRGNYGMPVRFDKTDGYIGINQLTDRILLSPAQVKALIAFIEKKT